MARRKRGGKTTITRKTRSTSKQLENLNQEELVSRSPSESEESGSSGTPKSCNTPNIEKSQALTVQHKKFRKFRCLDETSKTEISSSESEALADNLEMEQKEFEIIPGHDSIIEGMKSVEIIEFDSSQEPPSSEDIQEEISINETVDDNSICEILSSDPVIPVIENEDTVEMQVVENDETSSEDKSSDSNSKSNDNELVIETKTSDDTSETNSDANTSTVRRSSRIRSISVLKQRSKGRGLVRSEKFDKNKKSVTSEELLDGNNSDKFDNETTALPLDSPSLSTPSGDGDVKPVKVKSRWRRSSELELGGTSPLTAQPQISPLISDLSENQNDSIEENQEESEVDEEMEKKLRHFETLTENRYLTERTSCREAKKMVCDCFLIEDEIERGEFGCGEDCLNRLLMIECGNQCNSTDQRSEELLV